MSNVLSYSIHGHLPTSHYQHDKECASHPVLLRLDHLHCDRGNYKSIHGTHVYIPVPIHTNADFAFSKAHHPSTRLFNPQLIYPRYISVNVQSYIVVFNFSKCLLPSPNRQRSPQKPKNHTSHTSNKSFHNGQQSLTSLLILHLNVEISRTQEIGAGLVSSS